MKFFLSVLKIEQSIGCMEPLTAYCADVVVSYSCDFFWPIWEQNNQCFEKEKTANFFIFSLFLSSPSCQYKQ